jgi:hypothetical protein
MTKTIKKPINWNAAIARMCAYVVAFWIAYFSGVELNIAIMVGIAAMLIVGYDNINIYYYDKND